MRLTTSVYPSVCGWHVVENSNLVPSLLHKHLQKWLKNLVSRSETIVLGTPCRRTISLKNKSATFVASSLLRQGMKCAILENRSTTTKVLSLPLFFEVILRQNPLKYPPKAHGEREEACIDHVDSSGTYLCCK